MKSGGRTECVNGQQVILGDNGLSIPTNQPCSGPTSEPPKSELPKAAPPPPPAPPPAARAIFSQWNRFASSANEYLKSQGIRVQVPEVPAILTGPPERKDAPSTQPPVAPAAQPAASPPAAQPAPSTAPAGAPPPPPAPAKTPAAAPACEPQKVTFHYYPEFGSKKGEAGVNPKEAAREFADKPWFKKYCPPALQLGAISAVANQVPAHKRSGDQAEMTEAEMTEADAYKYLKTNGYLVEDAPATLPPCEAKPAAAADAGTDAAKPATRRAAAAPRPAKASYASRF